MRDGCGSIKNLKENKGGLDASGKPLAFRKETETSVTVGVLKPDGIYFGEPLKKETFRKCIASAL